jgi:hypothetical protein
MFKELKLRLRILLRARIQIIRFKVQVQSELTQLEVFQKMWRLVSKLEISLQNQQSPKKIIKRELKIYKNKIL